MSLVLTLLLGGLAIIGVVLLGRWSDSLDWRKSLLAFRLVLPQTLKPEAVSKWLMTVNAATYAPKLALLPTPPLALEVSATARGIEHYLLVPKAMRSVILSGLRAGLPGVRLEEAPDYLKHRPRFTMAAEAGLSNHRRPLHSEQGAVASSSMLAALNPLYGTEEIRVQWLVTGGGIPAPVPSVSANGKHSWWLADAVSIDPEAVHAARLKQEAPLLRAVVRVGISGTRSRARSLLLFGRVWSSLRTLNATGAGLVRRWWLPPSVAAARVAHRSIPLLARWPLTLNTGELAGLMGLSVADVHLPGLTVGGARQIPPAPVMPTHGVVLGVSDYPGLSERKLALHTVDRLQHLHVIGPTGTGKSTLLANMALQDIEAGLGVILVDPKGDLVEAITERFPDKRRDDLIVLDPSETDRPVGFNPLNVAGGEHERELAVDHALHVFREIYADFWGPRTDDVLRSALLTLVHFKAHNGSPFTLCEVPALLTNDAFRRSLGAQAIPEQLKPFWAWYHGLKPADRLTVTGPVMNKLRAFTDRTSIRLMLGQAEGLDLPRVISKRQVLLVSLAKGRLGQETAELTGSLLVAALWQAALGRVQVAQAERRPVMLYLDEFQDVLKLGAVGEMLAQARGLGLGLTLAHQHLHQLPKDVAHDVLGTARSQAIFQLGYEDAHVLARSTEPAITADDLMGLEPFTAVLRACVSARTLPPATMATMPLAAATTDGRTVAEASRERYGTARTDVVAGLKARVASRPAGSGGTPGRIPHGGRT